MTRKTFLTLGLLAVFVLSACTPTVLPPTPAPASGAEADAPPMDDTTPVQEEAPEAAPAAATDEAPAEEPMAAPTSRGTQLAATDPNTVNLASGEPQLIEFFAFW